MKIVLLCVGGISSSILAKRLQKYSDENGKEDFFQAERYGSVSYGGLECDLFLIAPQISKLICESPGFESIPSERLLYVSEEDYSNINVEGVYHRIDKIREIISHTAVKKARWSVEKRILLRGISCCFVSILVYGMIVMLEISFSFSIGFARLLLPLMVMCRYAAAVSDSKKENSVLHMANLICLFMMVIPFEVIRMHGTEETSSSILVIDNLRIHQFAQYCLLSMMLYTLYTLWEDWFLEKNRFMIKMMRDSMCSGLFFMAVIIIRLLLSFFVIK